MDLVPIDFEQVAIEHDQVGELAYLDGAELSWRKERKRLSLSSEITLHTFRHDFATYVANLPGVPITEVRDVLGHASVVHARRLSANTTECRIEQRNTGRWH